MLVRQCACSCNLQPSQCWHSKNTSSSENVVPHGAQAGVPCLEVFIARGPDGELRQQASVLRPSAAKAPARMGSSTDVEEALAAGALPVPGHPSPYTFYDVFRPAECVGAEGWPLVGWKCESRRLSFSFVYKQRWWALVHKLLRQLLQNIASSHVQH